MGSRPARLLRPVVVLAVLGGLAACTAGVPQTDEVVSVSSVTSAPQSVDPEAPRDLGGPFPGQDETDVVVGFMNAMNTGDVAKIQRWVMPSARDAGRAGRPRPPPCGSTASSSRAPSTSARTTG